MYLEFLAEVSFETFCFDIFTKQVKTSFENKIDFIFQTNYFVNLFGNVRH